MQPITREAIIERRATHVRWSAVLAGALAAGGLWLLLQLLFTGGALAAIDPDEVDHVGTFGVGASIGSILAPLVAMFAGGLLAGRLAAHSDKRVLGLHGALVWALASVAGVWLTANALSHLAARPVTTHVASNAPAPGSEQLVEQQLDQINEQLKAANAPQITKDELALASRHSMTAQGTIDRSALIARLDEKTKLSRPEAEAAVTALGERTPEVVAHASQMAAHREDALEAAEASGKAMLALGVGLLLCLGAAIAGSLLGQRVLRMPGDGPRRRDLDSDLDDPRTAERPVAHHTTAPYPVTPMVGTRNPVD